MKKTECWVLTGPTASGKSDLAVQIALKNQCEIICMDSMQIYRGMDIGTAKPTPAEQELVPHHMLDIVDPGTAFSVVEYRDMAYETIHEIASRGRRPLLVGGTGFYLRALRHPMAMGDVPADPALRKEMEIEAETPEGKKRLHQKLQTIDPVSAARLHENDVRRVIRALEVSILSGIPFSRQRQPEEDCPIHCRCICLTMDREILYARINQRVENMLHAGLVREVERLLQQGVSPEAQAMQGIGYKEVVLFLQGKCTLEEAADMIKLNTRHYAKRQLTWMRREEDLLWLDHDNQAFSNSDKYFKEEQTIGYTAAD